jgi:two-component system nitrate/nitrite response regulator NarL
VRVVVADDHPMFRAGVVWSLDRRPDIEVVSAVGDGHAAFEEIRRLLPDVAVLDVRMPDLDGPGVLEAVRREELPTSVLLLSPDADGDIAYRALAAGAAGFLSKAAEPDELCEAVIAVARGETVISRHVQTGLAAGIRRRAAEVDRPVLTTRERQVLRCLAAGRSAPEIGKTLHVSPSTVKTHLQTLYEKLGVSDRAAAVAQAMRRGLID